MELPTTVHAVSFLPFWCSEVGTIFRPCALVIESSQRFWFVEKYHRAVLESFSEVGPRLWFFCMHLLRPIDGPSPLAVPLSRDPP